MGRVGLICEPVVSCGQGSLADDSQLPGHFDFQPVLGWRNRPCQHPVGAMVRGRVEDRCPWGSRHLVEGRPAFYGSGAIGLGYRGHVFAGHR